MSDIYSIQYESKGNTEFILPFSINNSEEVIVWVNNTLQNLTYYVNLDEEENSINNQASISKNSKSFGKVIFLEPVGTPDQPAIVTLEKKKTIERLTDFKDYTIFRADNLNFELDNFVSILKSLELTLQSSVLRSKLENKKHVIIFPKSEEGKGIYWGKNGELLNTKNNINNLKAEDITLKTDQTNIKCSNLQEYAQQIDKSLAELSAKYINLEKSLINFKKQ